PYGPRGRPKDTATFSSHRRASSPPDVARALHDFADEAVREGLLGAEPMVALGVTLDALGALPRRLCQDALDALADREHLLHLDFDVGGGTTHAAERLMQQKARVR